MYHIMIYLCTKYSQGEKYRVEINFSKGIHRGGKVSNIRLYHWLKASLSQLCFYELTYSIISKFIGSNCFTYTKRMKNELLLHSLVHLQVSKTYVTQAELKYAKYLKHFCRKTGKMKNDFHIFLSYNL